MAGPGEKVKRENKKKEKAVKKKEKKVGYQGKCRVKEE